MWGRGKNENEKFYLPVEAPKTHSFQSTVVGLLHHSAGIRLHNV